MQQRKEQRDRCWMSNNGDDDWKVQLAAGRQRSRMSMMTPDYYRGGDGSWEEAIELPLYLCLLTDTERRGTIRLVPWVGAKHLFCTHAPNPVSLLDALNQLLSAAGQ